jgi:lysophospholipase L1-like esterase
MVLGDSAAAGVGASTMQESLTGQLVEQLRDSYTVEWCLVAKTGATTASTLRHVEKRSFDRFDVCVTSLGVNDVTSGLGLKAWIAQQSELRRILREKLEVKHIIMCGLPPVHGFPSLPQPLRWWLGARATAFDKQLQQHTAGESDISFFSLRFTEDRSLMASDNFHPGPKIYREWAIRVAALIKDGDNRPTD